MSPIYLVLINLFVIPIAVAGLLTFRGSEVHGDMFVLMLPIAGGSRRGVALAAFMAACLRPPRW